MAAWNPVAIPGQSNGRLPLATLVAVPNYKPIGGGGFGSIAAGSNLMRADAAQQMSLMMQGFYARFGVRLDGSEFYRPIPVQDRYWDRYINRRPGWTLAAQPGTSPHGWAISGDLSVNGGNPSGEHLAWLREHAADYGFVNDVASEPWHWSFRVTPKITIDHVIDNPNQNSLAQAVTGGNMFILFEHAKRGQALGGPGFFHALTPEEAPWAGAISYVHIVCVNERHFDLIKVMCTAGASAVDGRLDEIKKTLSGVPDSVWGALIDAPENGKQQARARVAGADMGRNLSDAAVAKIVKALPPASSGGTAPGVDVDKLRTDIVRDVLDGLAKRLVS